MRTAISILGMMITLMVSCSVVAQVPLNVDLRQISALRFWRPVEQKKTSLVSKPLTLIVMLSSECPMSVLYTKTLNQLQHQFSANLQINGVFSGKSFTDKEIVTFSSTYNLAFPVFNDPKMKIARSLNAKVTPEVFLFQSDGKMVYSGAIDNWMLGLGKKKLAADEHYLRWAIEQTLNGEPVSRSVVKAQGCLLNDY